MSDNHDMLIHFLRHGGDILTHEQSRDEQMTIEDALHDDDFKYPNHDSYPTFYVCQTENYRRDDFSYTLNGGSCSSGRGISYSEHKGTLHFVEGEERPTLNIPMVFELMEKIADSAIERAYKLADRTNYTIEVWHSASLMKDGMTLGGYAADSKRSAMAKYGADALHTTSKTIIVRFLDEEGKTSCACDDGKVSVQLYQFRNRYYDVTCPVCNGSGRRVPEAMTMRTVDEAVQRQTNRRHSNVPDMIDYRLEKAMEDYSVMQQPPDINYQQPNIKQIMNDYREYIAQHAPMLCACGSCISDKQALFPNYANKTYGCVECADKKPAVLKELSQ